MSFLEWSPSTPTSAYLILPCVPSASDGQCRHHSPGTASYILHIPHPIPSQLLCRTAGTSGGAEDSREFRFRGTTHCLLITITYLCFYLCAQNHSTLANPAALHYSRVDRGPDPARCLQGNTNSTTLPPQTCMYMYLTSTRFLTQRLHARDTVSASTAVWRSWGAELHPRTLGTRCTPSMRKL